MNGNIIEDFTQVELPRHEDKERESHYLEHVGNELCFLWIVVCHGSKK